MVTSGLECDRERIGNESADNANGCRRLRGTVVKCVGEGVDPGEPACGTCVDEVIPINTDGSSLGRSGIGGDRYRIDCFSVTEGIIGQ